MPPKKTQKNEDGTLHLSKTLTDGLCKKCQKASKKKTNNKRKTTKKKTTKKKPASKKKTTKKKTNKKKPASKKKTNKKTTKKQKFFPEEEHDYTRKFYDIDSLLDELLI